MRLRLMIFSILVFGFFLASSGLDQQSAEELYQSGLYKEEVNGDLQGAIDLYKQIIAKFRGNRVIAAKAQLHIGLCYEKLGLKEAEKAFRNVVDNYPDQAKTVRMAREKLATLARVKAIAQKGEQNLSIKKAWTGKGADLLGGISPDGKYLCFTDWNTGDLAFRELATGKNRRITDKGSWLKSSAFAIFSKWSPDGRFIAYSWYNPEGDRFELNLVGIDKSKPEILFDNKDKEYGDVIPLDWHPNGKQILTAFTKGDSGETLEIGFVSVADKNVKIIKTLERKMAGWGFAISPDGRTIAYSRSSKQNPKNKDIFLLSADGTHEQRLIDHPASEDVCGWTSDGRHLLFGSDRTGDQGLWIVQVKEGRALENPNLIKADMGRFVSLGITQQNQLYVGHYKGGYDIYQAEIDPATGQFLAPPVKQVRLYEGCNLNPECSPDGKYFTYVSSRGSFPRVTYFLCIYSFENDEIRELNTEFKNFNKFSTPQWRPDGRAISVAGRDHLGRRGFHLIEVESGKSSPLVLIGENERLLYHRWAVDGHTLFYTKGERGKASFIYSHDLKTGRDKMLPGSPDGARVIDISPDGKWLAFLNRGPKRRLGIIPTAGGVPQELYSFESKGQPHIPLAWSADGKYVFFSSKTTPADVEWDMWRFSVEDRQVQKTNFNTVSFRYMSAHPDGRHIIFSTEANRAANSEVWVIENFLSRTKARK